MNMHVIDKVTNLKILEMLIVKQWILALSQLFSF